MLSFAFKCFCVYFPLLLASRLIFTDAAYWSLSPCDVVMCLKGRGSHSLKQRWLHFSTSDKNDRRRDLRK